MVFYDPINSGSPTDATESIDYDLIYKNCYNAFYDAMEAYFNAHQLHTDNNTYNTYNTATPCEPLEYSSATDARLYTVEVASAVTSSPQATEAYTLDTRNILLIFALTWLCVTLYSKIKNLILNYTTKN